ncbi:MAG: AAA family ATPase [Paludibacteraceae bacterium]|nr:AAA family ATPase [Paludibacteraceae bacterium]
METLFARQDRLMKLTDTKIVRSAMRQINWDAPLLAIRGPRGVGKTTLMLQYIKLHYPAHTRKALYCSLDSLYFTSHRLLDLVDVFYKNGGVHLFLDEVHKYTTWSREIKEIYDSYPDIRVVFSASSLLQILNGDADLSRRCVAYDMQGLSFREFLHFYKKIEVPVYTLQQLLDSPAEACDAVCNQCHPLPYFNEYLQYGYYPYYLRDRMDYYTVIEQVINLVVESELTQLCGVDVANVRKVKSLIGILATSVPFEVDVSKIATAIEIHRNTVISYLADMARADILNLLYSDLLSVKRMQKPDKIYLENANLLYALATRPVNIGTARETFVVNQLKFQHTVEYGKTQGDFKVDGKYIFEVGGADKTYKQIADLPHSYVLADGMEAPYGHKLPLWIVGLLY